MSVWADLIPEFDLEEMVVAPWTAEFDPFGWILLMGFLVAFTCGLVGNFIVARRMALVGDAISHSLLPGIVLAFMLTASLAIPVMLVGAMVAGVATTVLIEIIHKNSRVKTDAALGIVFSLFFAVGVILINLYTSEVHFDAECVLYGEIEYLTLAERISLGLVEVPLPIVWMLGVGLVVVGLVVLLYKELLVTSFDPGLARSLGIPVGVYHYGLMAVLSVVIVSAFEAVGVILVIAMLIFPATTAAMLSNRLPVMLAMSLCLAAVYAVGGLHLALILDSNIAGSMVVVAGSLFGLVWLFSPQRGLLVRWVHSVRQKTKYAENLTS